MIEWSIDAARRSNCFDKIVVSTDDPQIAEVAVAAGAEAPFLRSAALSDDYTPTAPVLADAIQRLGVPDQTPVCCLYATAPFVRAEDLQAGLNSLKETGARFVVSVTTFAFPIQRALLRNDQGRISMIDPERILARSQDLPQGWHDCGQFYWALAKTWQESDKGIFSEGALGVEIPRYRVQDIDTLEDWARAEIIKEVLDRGDNMA